MEPVKKEVPKGKITREVAEADITAWMDGKKLTQSQRDQNKDSIDTLVDSVMDGVLRRDETTNALIHTLAFPIGKQSEQTTQVSELTYKPRLNDKQKQSEMKGVKANDFDGRFNALIAALTGKTRGEIELLDTVDHRIALSVGIFFT